jgi:hypothetical protein
MQFAQRCGTHRLHVSERSVSAFVSFLFVSSAGYPDLLEPFFRQLICQPTGEACCCAMLFCYFISLLLQFLECYSLQPCPAALNWGDACTCSNGDCSVTANSLTRSVPGRVPRVPAPAFTVVGNTTLSSGGLIMQVTDLVRVKGTLTVSGVLSLTNATTGMFVLVQVSPLVRNNAKSYHSHFGFHRKPQIQRLPERSLQSTFRLRIQTVRRQACFSKLHRASPCWSQSLARVCHGMAFLVLLWGS